MELSTYKVVDTDKTVNIPQSPIRSVITIKIYGTVVNLQDVFKTSVCKSTNDGGPHKAFGQSEGFNEWDGRHCAHCRTASYQL